jgi:hypothetical protein
MAAMQNSVYVPSGAREAAGWARSSFVQHDCDVGHPA